jgi:iron complex outermembrane receptor protein
MKLKTGLSMLAAAISAQLFLASTGVVAQEKVPQEAVDDAELETIMVVARKRTESIHDVPLAITALGAEQIEAQKIRDLTSLAVGIPNVSFDDLGTTKGTANFSIRGLGINSSVASIDPTVGVFVDGVYMGINSGIIFDTFDLESIEVLRGPQGILFGRNVTGGAVLLNTKKPSDVFEASIRTSIEGGGEKLNKYLMGSVSGPLSDTVAAKLTVYKNDDDGWHKNLATGNAFGKSDTIMVRPVVTWQASDDTEWVFRYEYQENESDGPAAQSHTNGRGIPGAFGNFDRNSFDFSVDEEGFSNSESHFFSTETNVDVELGDGTITNIFGWRNYESQTNGDIDASPQWLFHAPADIDAEQFSNELRYNGQFDKTNVTTGLYYFTNSIAVHETRDLLGIATGGVAPALTQDGGGNYDVSTTGVFVALDHEIDDKWAVNGGIRYTRENKDVEIASLIANQNAPCFVLDGTCPFDFVDDKTWTSLSPKLGVTYEVDRRTNLYGHWSRGFRSGGYNLRNTSGDLVNNGPGPFDEEQVDNFELGYKARSEHGRVSAALFYNTVKDMQREVNNADPVSGVVQVIKNTADATLYGIELDTSYSITDSLRVLAAFGYTNSSYDKVTLDLNGDGLVNQADEDLDIPRAPELTYSLGLSHTTEFADAGELVSRLSYAYRDESAYTDSNLGYLTEQEMVDAGMDFYADSGGWSVGIYAKNLLDEVKHGGDTQLPATLGGVPLGGTFSPLAKGRVFGIELTVNFE